MLHKRVTRSVCTQYTDLNLHQGCAKGNLGLVKFALEEGQPVNSVLSGVLPIHLAALYGSQQVVALLLEHGADVNAPRMSSHVGPDKGGAYVMHIGTASSTALHFAAVNGHFAVARQLLDAGANPLLKEKYGATAEDLARAMGHQNLAFFLASWATSYSQAHPELASTAGPSKLRNAHSRHSLRSVWKSRFLKPQQQPSQGQHQGDPHPRADTKSSTASADTTRTRASSFASTSSRRSSVSSFQKASPETPADGDSSSSGKPRLTTDSLSPLAIGDSMVSPTGAPRSPSILSSTGSGSRSRLAPIFESGPKTAIKNTFSFKRRDGNSGSSKRLSSLFSSLASPSDTSRADRHPVAFHPAAESNSDVHSDFLLPTGNPAGLPPPPPKNIPSPSPLSSTAPVEFDSPSQPYWITAAPHAAHTRGDSDHASPVSSPTADQNVLSMAMADTHLDDDALDALLLSYGRSDNSTPRQTGIDNTPVPDSILSTSSDTDRKGGFAKRIIHGIIR